HHYSSAEPGDRFRIGTVRPGKHKIAESAKRTDEPKEQYEAQANPCGNQRLLSKHRNEPSSVRSHTTASSSHRCRMRHGIRHRWSVPPTVRTCGTHRGNRQPNCTTNRPAKHAVLDGTGRSDRLRQRTVGRVHHEIAARGRFVRHALTAVTDLHLP